eukprot:15055685-Alexandrium_andersonii.AAC.1
MPVVVLFVALSCRVLAVVRRRMHGWPFGVHCWVCSASKWPMVCSDMRVVTWRPQRPTVTCSRSGHGQRSGRATPSRPAVGPTCPKQWMQRHSPVSAEAAVAVETSAGARLV